MNVNREALRVHTSIRDEDILFTDVLGKLKLHDRLLYGAVNDWCRRRRTTNAHLLAHLLRLYSLEGYTGTCGPGTHVGPPREQFSTPEITPEDDDCMDTADSPSVSAPAPPSALSLDDLAAAEALAVEHDEREEAVGVEEDDEGAVTDLMEHISNIAVVM